MLVIDDWSTRTARDLSNAVLAEIAKGGLASVKIATIADRLEVSLARIYRTWGRRQMIFELTWRHCVFDLNAKISTTAIALHRSQSQVDLMIENVFAGLPQELNAFIELHTARRQWMRQDTEPDGVFLPALLKVIEVEQCYGHIRPGPPALLAAVTWWIVMGCCTNSPYDRSRISWCQAATRRALLTHDAYLFEDPLHFEITVEEPEATPTPPTPKATAPR